MPELKNVDPTHVTDEKISKFIEQLFKAMADQAAATGGGVAVGIKGGEPAAFGIFKMSSTTGRWSFSGSDGKTTYVQD